VTQVILVLLELLELKVTQVILVHKDQQVLKAAEGLLKLLTHLLQQTMNWVRSGSTQLPERFMSAQMPQRT
jgi:hypothetical protein